MKLRFLTGLLFLLFTCSAYATHQRAAEITYKHIEGLTYEVKIITYTYTPSPADRPELTIDWGDGTSSVLQRTEKINLPENISLNVYEYRPDQGATTNRHTYSSQGTYILSLEDPNRNFGIVNIPNSVNVPMYVQSELVVNPFLGFNNSPVLLNPPIDVGCQGETYYHNPGAFDIDGDSLSYRLIDCKTTGGIDIPGYTLPPATNSISIDPVRGDFIWDAPTQQGEFNIAILIEEWRNGVKIGSVTRDMQIEIVACDNSPPVIEAISDTCIEAGQELQFDILAYDPELTAVEITVSGGPFEVSNSPAFIDPDPAVGPDTARTTFYWETTCSHVQQQPYQVFIKAEDSGFPIKLVSFKTILITVISPAPENLTTQPIGSSIRLEWDRVECDKAIGYKVYRRNGYYGFFPGFCETGVPAYTGYRLIGETDGIDATTYIDDNNGIGLVQGIEYCYMVTAFFLDGAESYASLEACASLKRDVPVITNVSNDSTDLLLGDVYLAWSRPTELDTIEVPGPYEYIVFRDEGFGGGSGSEIATLEGLNDTILTDNGVDLNNSGTPYSYRIELVSLSQGSIGFSQTASSVFLDITPTDEELELSWQFNVPWQNDYYTIFRRLPGENVFDSIGISFETTYRDTLLDNGNEYCYYVRSTGQYTAPGFIHPIENFSQITCGVPFDNEPPCPPVLELYTDCERAVNRLFWTNPNNYCADDVVKYRIFYSPLDTGDLVTLDSTLNAFDTSYVHSNFGNIVGCYAVSAIDSVGNESDLSNIVCVSDTTCNRYELPNVFTPNDDNYNDFFRPFPYTSVERVEMRIFNRWGNLVFETEDPDINWDGRNQFNGTDCAQGTYLYVCEVYEITLRGIQRRSLRGSITLLR